ncbi:hypothetical protein ACTNIF_000321 [Campylobacter coli]|uniref:Uncharacterized protein n=1 Tax=Campylobacter coli TaxID=195 RepID=A0A6F9HZ02_CAMCO|nr:hypothetical protein [Campylobacter coli]EAK5386459.1 hypothetical protein [Campylobacter coli]EAL5305702.1 hypothetical protein [Campylobacter coli]EDI8430708.1 hypothetical protein [Campylobacter coli]EDO8948699.1 hypothetical protein [Campylobacter coli]
MTQEQFNEIKERLAKWRKERHLTYENQREEFLGNVFEKISKYFRAKDDLERIDALCNIAVFYTNSFSFKHKIIPLDSDFLPEDLFSHLIYELSISCIEKGNKLNLKFIEKNLGYGFLILIEMILKDLGFNFYKCMLETLKEIESRTGYYDEGLNKFTKDKGAYNTKEAYDKFLKENISDDFYVLEDNEEFVIFDKENDFALDKFKKWYKADYESCRI